jgi:hypothetical protein
MSVSFIQCGPEHVSSLRDFFARNYGPDYVLRRESELLDWQFQGAPADPGRYHMKLAMVGNEIAATLGYIPVGVTVGPEVARGAWTANWMVDARFRHMGLGPMLMRDLTREHDVVLDLGISADAAAILPRMGWCTVGTLSRWIAVLDPVAAADLANDDRLRQIPRARPRTRGAEFAITRVDRFDEDVTRFWDAIWDGKVVGTRRSASFLNWRYAAHPVFEYRLLEIRSGGALRGFAVHRIEAVAASPFKIGRIVELVAARPALDHLLAEIVSDATANELVAVDFFCANRRYADTLTSAGFAADDAPLTECFPILFQPIDRTRRSVALMAHPAVLKSADWPWHVTKGDGDQDRPN